MASNTRARPKVHREQEAAQAAAAAGGSCAALSLLYLLSLLSSHWEEPLLIGSEAHILEAALRAEQRRRHATTFGQLPRDAHAPRRARKSRGSARRRSPRGAVIAQQRRQKKGHVRALKSRHHVTKSNAFRTQHLLAGWRSSLACLRKRRASETYTHDIARTSASRLLFNALAV